MRNRSTMSILRGAGAIMGLLMVQACSSGPSQKDVAVIQAELDKHPYSQRIPNGTVCVTYPPTDPNSLADIYKNVAHVHIQTLRNGRIGPVTIYCQYYTWDTGLGIEQAPAPLTDGSTTAQTSFETIGRYVVDSIVSEQPQGSETVVVFNEHFDPNELGKALNTPGLTAPPQAQRDNVQAVITMNSAGERVAQVASADE
jgi:hypothetical protein